MVLWDRGFSFPDPIPSHKKGKKEGKNGKMKKDFPKDQKDDLPKNENQNENQNENEDQGDDLQKLVDQKIRNTENKSITISYSGIEGKRRFSISGSKLEKVSEKTGITFKNEKGKVVSYFSVKENETPILFKKLYDRIVENGFIFKNENETETVSETETETVSK